MQRQRYSIIILPLKATVKKFLFLMLCDCGNEAKKIREKVENRVQTSWWSYSFVLVPVVKDFYA